MLACTADQTDLNTKQGAESCQCFAHVTHAKGPDTIKHEHIYVR